MEKPENNEVEEKDNINNKDIVNDSNNNEKVKKKSQNYQ